MYTNKTENNIASSQSPFHLEEHWSIQIENHNRNCTHTEIDILLSKGILNHIDFEIIKLLGRCKYINTRNITIAMSYILPPAYQKEDYSRNLKKLVNAGILLRHYITLADCDTPHTPISPLRFYSLSAGAHSYIAEFLDSSSNPSAFLSDVQIIESLAASQFMIQLRASQDLQITNCHQLVIRKVCNTALLIPAECYIRTRSQKPPFRLFLLCGRSRQDSLTNVVKTCSIFLKHLNARDDQSYPYLIIILLESIHDISVVHKRISMQSSYFNLSLLYYTTDNTICTESFWHSLYQCAESDGFISITRVKLSPV